jgi:cytoskeletal protein RodZ
VSNRADLIIGLLVVVLIILGLGVYALFSQNGQKTAAPSVTPSAEEITGATTPPASISPVPATPSPAPSATPGRPSPESASPTRGALATPSPVQGAGRTASPATSPSASPTRTAPPVVAKPSPSPSPTGQVSAAGTAKTGSGSWWILGLIPIALSLLLMRSLRQET